MSAIKHYRELNVYQNAMEWTMKVHAEIAWRSGYLTEAQFREIDDAYDHIMGQIVKMADQPDKWLIRPRGAESVNRRIGEPATPSNP